jgi:hypothetical protein
MRVIRFFGKELGWELASCVVEFYDDSSRPKTISSDPDSVLLVFVQLVACRREFVTADASGGVGVLPANGACICRVGVDVSAELPRQVEDGSEDAACNHVTLNLCEPEFNLVEP